MCVHGVLINRLAFSGRPVSEIVTGETFKSTLTHCFFFLLIITCYSLLSCQTWNTITIVGVVFFFSNVINLNFLSLLVSFVRVLCPMYRMSAQTNKKLKSSAREGSIAVTNLTDLFLAHACVCIHFWKYRAVFYGKKLSQGKKRIA